MTFQLSLFQAQASTLQVVKRHTWVSK